MPAPAPQDPARNGCVEPALTSLLVEAIKEIASAEAASILVPDNQGNLVFALVAGGAGLHLAQFSIPIETGIAGRVFTSGLPELAHFPAATTAAKQVEDKTGFITKSLLAIPLLDRNGAAFAVAEAVNPTPCGQSEGSFREPDLRALMQVQEPLSDAFRALQQLAEDPGAMPRFYRAVVTVMNRRTDILRQRNSDLHSSRRAFEMTRARHYSDEKMIALARMASGIAHEINNPLSVAVSNIGSLSETCTDLAIDARSPEEQDLIDDIREMTDDVQKEMERINKIIARLMFFGDRDVKTVERVDLSHEIKRIMEVIEDTQARGIALTLDLGDVAPVFAGRSHVRQVLLELIENAVHAASRTKSKDGGKVEIRVFASGGTIHASIGDNGPGIEEKNLERVFEPFFTDKSDWHSTGLGLTAAYGVMQTLGGQIAIDSVPGRGTIVVASFPIEQQESASERADTWKGRITSDEPSESASPAQSSGRYYE